MSGFWKYAQEDPDFVALMESDPAQYGDNLRLLNVLQQGFVFDPSTMQLTEAVAAALAGQAEVDDDLGWIEATATAPPDRRPPAWSSPGKTWSSRGRPRRWRRNRQCPTGVSWPPCWQDPAWASSSPSWERK